MKIEKILVVDDNEGDQFLAEITIESYNSEIVIIKAYDGQEALDTLAKEDKAPDIILLDINMPGMNGHDFLAVYSQQKDSTSVIVMLTSSDQSRDREKCDTYPCVKKYIVKPLSVEKLSELDDLL